MSIKIRLLALFLSIAPVAWAQASEAVTVYKSPSCGCCGKWADHLKAAGFKVDVINSADVGLERKRLGMPDQYGSCHTAKVGNYIIEGHVPATDIQRLLKEKPKAIGLSAPGMPASAPGMDSPNKTPYETLLVKADGAASTFAKH